MTAKIFLTKTHTSVYPRKDEEKERDEEKEAAKKNKNERKPKKGKTLSSCMFFSTTFLWSFSSALCLSLLLRRRRPFSDNKESLFKECIPLGQERTRALQKEKDRGRNQTKDRERYRDDRWS